MCLATEVILAKIHVFLILFARRLRGSRLNWKLLNWSGSGSHIRIFTFLHGGKIPDKKSIQPSAGCWATAEDFSTFQTFPSNDRVFANACKHFPWNIYTRRRQNVLMEAFEK